MKVRSKLFKSTTGRVLGFVAVMGASTAMVGAAAAGTGAYFSDSRTGTTSGTIGSIRVTTAGGGGADGLDFNFANLLPGESQKATATYTNTGHNNQDVWLVFPNADALHAINDLGHYGEVHVTSNGTEIFASSNLNDNSGGGCPTGCTPLPQAIKLASNVAPNATGSFSFAFNYAGKLKGKDAEGAPFNCYPVTNPVSCDRNGLPYQVVATQHGISPSDPNNTPSNVGPGH